MNKGLVFDLVLGHEQATRALAYSPHARKNTSDLFLKRVCVSSTPNPLFLHNYLLLTPWLLSKWNKFVSICRMFLTQADFRKISCKTAIHLGRGIFLDSKRWHSYLCFHWQGWSNPTFESLINKQAYDLWKIDEFISHFYSLHHTNLATTIPMEMQFDSSSK